MGLPAPRMPVDVLDSTFLEPPLHREKLRDSLPFSAEPVAAWGGPGGPAAGQWTGQGLYSNCPDLTTGSN